MLALTSLFHFALPAAQVDPEIELNMELVQEGDLIGNTHTGKLHVPGCRAIDMMKPEHIWYTDGDGFTPCGWCHGGSALNEFQAQATIDRFHTKEDPMDTVVCRDPEIEKLFPGCLECGSGHGVVKMYSHSEGFKLLGKPGKWWIYFECSSCGYETSLRKARHFQNNGK